jgi:hypothetical protein
LSCAISGSTPSDELEIVLGFQILMISHHAISVFDPYADSIYETVPTPDGAVALPWNPEPSQADDQCLGA